MNELDRRPRPVTGGASCVDSLRSRKDNDSGVLGGGNSGVSAADAGKGDE
ncbi:hypothetical protein ACFOQM_22555 [Paenibacillus sp. GCM10012307]